MKRIVARSEFAFAASAAIAAAAIVAVVLLGRWASALSLREREVRRQEQVVGDRLSRAAEMTRLADDKLRAALKMQENAEQMAKDARRLLGELQSQQRAGSAEGRPRSDLGR